MKKILSILMVSVMLLSICACGQDTLTGESSETMITDENGVITRTLSVEKLNTAVTGEKIRDREVKEGSRIFINEENPLFLFRTSLPIFSKTDTLISTYEMLPEDIKEFSTMMYDPGEISGSQTEDIIADFDKMLEMIYKTDFDILSHLTCPLRYINGKYKCDIDIHIFESKIKKILSEIIERGISLEINTSGYASNVPYFMPERDILTLYYEMGGRRVSIGSDAHVSANVAVGFDKALDMIRSVGFDSYVIYKQRKSHFISI